MFYRTSTCEAPIDPAACRLLLLALLLVLSALLARAMVVLFMVIDASAVVASIILFSRSSFNDTAIDPVAIASYVVEEGFIAAAVLLPELLLEPKEFIEKRDK